MGERAFLICDDAEINREIAALALADYGAEILFAENGAAALDALKKRPDTALVLMDLQMPVMDGFAAAAQIKKNPLYAKIVLIALTGDVSEEILNKCANTGFSGVLSKPLETAPLIKCLKKNGIAAKKTHKSRFSRRAAPGFKKTAKNEMPAPAENLSAEGLARFGGNEQKYKNALGSLNAEIAANISEINSISAKDAMFLAHKIKGAAANLGLSALGAAARAYEDALKKNASNVESLKNFIAECANFSAFCANILRPEPETKKKTCTREEFSSLIDDLKTALDDCNLKSCENATFALCSVNWPCNAKKKETLKNIVELTNNYDYAAAFALLNEF